MAWQNKPDEAVKSDWQTRSAKQRDELSRSIEETLADNALIEDPFSDGEDEAFLQSSKSSMIIPPILSLQSKQMPVVRIEPEDAPSVSSRATTNSVVVPPSSQKKRRLAGRNTKVQLQAVPRTEKKSSRKISVEEEQNSIGFDSGERNKGKNNSRQHASTEKGAAAKGIKESIISASLAGSGIIERGQRDVMITNTHISSSSVVTVTLIEDPGPVVVKYISIHPQTGFTLHFSDAAELNARFNYIII